MERRSDFEILLVDDNPADVHLIQMAFAKLDTVIHFSVVEDGEEALNFLARAGDFEDAPAPNLILLDLSLPKVKGIDVLKVIKAHDHLKKIPVIIMTSSQTESDRAQSYSAHANAYLVKPADAEDFFEIARAVDHFWFKTSLLA